MLLPHTSLDSAWGGVNDWLAKGLSTGEISALGSEKLNVSGTSMGAEGRLLILDKPVSVKELVSRVKQHLSLSQGRNLLLLAVVFVG